MIVGIKEFNVEMNIKTAGVELEVRDPDGRHRGDLVVTKANVIWCPGKTTRDNGKQISWDRFIAMMEALP